MLVVVILGENARVLVGGFNGLAGKVALFEVAEIAAGEGKGEAAAQKQVHEVHVGGVIGAEAQKMFDQLNHGWDIVGRAGGKARGGGMAPLFQG